MAVHSHTLYLSLRAGNIRLVGGSVPSEGRVELFYEGEWGRVGVYRYFATTTAEAAVAAVAARVACRQVGYPYSDGTRDFGPGSGPVWVSIISCNGDEERVEQCRHDSWKEIYYSIVLGVRCRGECLQGLMYIHRNNISMYMYFEESHSACHTISSAIP